ncbi:MAG: glycosyltransferase [Candidatus Kapaibacterium sp.]
MIILGKNTKPPLTIIIVNYNVRDFLLQCLRSIERAATHTDVEVIVVDNHSSDGSAAFLKPLFPQVTWIELQENLGFGKGNNVGIARAQGEYTLLLNPDTILSDDTLIVMKDYMDSHPEVGISGCKVLNADGSFQVQCRRGFPTPWASFCKLFGLQKLFPTSPLFARYNQTFRSENDEYYVDALIGAFMYCRTPMLQSLGGFDEDFFMYGEDLDLCFRASKAGWKTAYYPKTTTLHFKGESTRRSSMNEVKVFYEAMVIFARKHYGRSKLFLFLLQAGIWLRSLIAYASKSGSVAIVLMLDILLLNAALLLATHLRFGHYLAFPSFAYPVVFVTVTAVFVLSMLAVEGYYERKYPIRKVISGLMVAFFTLSSLTYFFKEYAFSRGVLLMMIAFTLMGAVLVRWGIGLWNSLNRTTGMRRIGIVGMNVYSESIIARITAQEAGQSSVVGIISHEIHRVVETYCSYPVIGNYEYIQKLIADFQLTEVIITDPEVSIEMLALSGPMLPHVKVHTAKNYEELIVSRLVAEVTGTKPALPQLRIMTFRNRVLKRGIDILGSVFLLTVGLPLVFLLAQNTQSTLRGLWNVLIGRKSLIGVYPTDGSSLQYGKIGLVSLAGLHASPDLSIEAREELNRYYAEKYTFSLDLDICLKLYWRK